MSNPLFGLLGNTQLSGKFGNIQALLNQFKQFQQTFKGDAKQQVQQMLNTGKITQNDYNNAVQLANQLMKMMK